MEMGSGGDRGDREKERPVSPSPSLPNSSSTYPWQSVEHDIAEARRLIEIHEYGRRVGELKDAEQAFHVR